MISRHSPGTFNGYTVSLPVRTPDRVVLEFSPVRAWRWGGLGFAVVAVAGSAAITLTQSHMAPFNLAVWFPGGIAALVGVMIFGCDCTRITVDRAKNSLQIEDQVFKLRLRVQSYPLEQIESLNFKRIHDSDDGDQDHLMLGLRSGKSVKVVNLLAPARADQIDAVRIARHVLQSGRETV